ncbi:MAG: hypothetical protein AAGC71_12225, partial [Pseudomonadota bacterium]
EEWLESRDAQKERGLDAAAASRGVLGVSYGELGAAVARTWQLPDSIRSVMVGTAQTPEVAGEDDSRMQTFAIFANELAGIAEGASDPSDPEPLRRLLDRYRIDVNISERYAVALLKAGYDKLAEAADVFEINVAKSEYCQRLLDWFGVASTTFARRSSANAASA